MTHIKFVEKLADGLIIAGEVLRGLRRSHVQMKKSRSIVYKGALCIRPPVS